MEQERLIEFLNRKVEEYNQPFFVEGDPVSVPHSFSRKQDIEISGFFAAVFSWGSRTGIIRKTNELMTRMDNQPYEFIRHHQAKDLQQLSGFKHRTFTEDDLFYFVEFLRYHYSGNDSLETAFLPPALRSPVPAEQALIHFRDYFFSLDHLKRTEKHIASPIRKSTCKRLNMFLRWMVRKDRNGVDFGIWQQLTPAGLICPIDLHVARVARRFRLLQRKQVDWLAAKELTARLRTFDPQDPVKYDFALFGLGVLEKF